MGECPSNSQVRLDLLNVIGNPQPLLSKLLEKFSDGRVRSGLCQAQTSVRPPSVLTRATRHERKETCQLPIINPQPATVVKARVTVIPPVKGEGTRGVVRGFSTVAPFGFS
jgi:hypothetical protein